MTLPASYASGAGMVDMSKVPHYFGPWPNWANSPLTLADAAVEIRGDGIGATATATVGADGTVTGYTVTNPGVGYTYAGVFVTGSGTGAMAAANITNTALVSSIAVNTTGAYYVQPVVTISGGGATTQATATAFGGVDSILLLAPGDGYTFPTVSIDAPDDPNGVQAEAHVDFDTVTGTIRDVVVDVPGSGYSAAPNIRILNGTSLSPIAKTAGSTDAAALATINVASITVDTFGVGYTSVPDVAITEGNINGVGSGATATASITTGGVTSITVVSLGSGYVTAGGIRKFTDELPGLCDPGSAAGCPNWATNPTAKFIPTAVPDTTSYPNADAYVIAVVQYRTSFSSSINGGKGTIARGYVQIETPQNAAISQHYPLTNEALDGTKTPILKPDGTQYYSVTAPQYLGPVVSATKDRPVRVVFRNLLPTGTGGDLFLPVDSTMMGSGMGNMTDPYDPAIVAGGTSTDVVRNPMCTDAKAGNMDCFSKNRATLHLHGGETPWISDGTVNQWITPAGDGSAWPKGVAVRNVPDMTECDAAKDDGCMTFYYTNQQSARMMWIHDHSFGITRLNVYAGEATGYMLTDATEKALVANGVIPSSDIPLIIQDKTFVPAPAQLMAQDPTWDSARWGGEGSLWYHHVYMPAQNPSAPNGMSAYGRWLYGPWFWPPASTIKYPPIDNPYYDPNCSLDVPSSWQYPQSPYCEPALIPGTPNVSAGMEQFNDTPLVNGTAYPTLNVDPKSYRFRILNAANDRFFNLQWYIGETATASSALNQQGVAIGATEVALKAAEVAAAKTEPTIYPTPDTALSPVGPDWIQIGTEGGFLPAPAVVTGHQPITWITDPTRFDAGNADKHSLLLGNAERADVIVDFSKFAGQTLILYNDAPAAFPARSPLYDYYTDNADLSPAGAPTTLPGFGPNTRTIMQVKVAAATPTAPAAAAFNLAKLRKAFSHKADGSGVFESSQNPIVVGQAPYNSAYGTNFVKTGYCSSPSKPSARCDGLARIDQQGGTSFKFDTLSRNANGTVKQLSIPIEPKSMHDETNATDYDEFGRMQANLGVELFPATPGAGGAILYQYQNPATEIFDGTGMSTADVKLQPISTTTDGTQIWKITHNGVDTHPIHFHAFDVQLINRVTWDNIILAPDANELGWKETVRVSPLEDTYVAIRPTLPKLPWELTNSIHRIDVLKPDGATLISNTIAGNLGITTSFMSPDGNPSDLINHYANYGAEYLWHCHILSHEEMDMMRPIAIAYPPVAPTQIQASITGPAGRVVTLRWMDSSVAETSYLVQRRLNSVSPWVTQSTVRRPITDTYTNTVAEMTFTQTVAAPTVIASLEYRVVAQNTVGDTWNYAAGNPAGTGAFPTVTAKSYSATSNVVVTPTDLKVNKQVGNIVKLELTNRTVGLKGFQIEYQAKGTTTWTAVTPVWASSAAAGTIVFPTFTLPTLPKATEYNIRVAAVTATGLTTYPAVTNATSMA